MLVLGLDCGIIARLFTQLLLTVPRLTELSRKGKELVGECKFMDELLCPVFEGEIIWHHLSAVLLQKLLEDFERFIRIRSLVLGPGLNSNLR